MAVYKVPQDVEADDKLIGPFSFRQFIYLLIVAAGLFVGWLLSRIFIGLIIIPLPFILFFGVLALPLRKDQPMEVYLTAVIKFFLKPKVRLWGPDGSLTMVTITAPQVAERPLTKSFSGDEAEARLSYLAQIVDTRGWASRGVAAPIGSSSLHDTVAAEAETVNDVFEETGNIGQSFDSLIEQQDAIRKRQMISQMKQAVAQPAAAPVAVTPAPQTPASLTSYLADNSAQSTPAFIAVDDVQFNPYPSAMHQKVLRPVSDDDTPTPHVPMPVPYPASAPPQEETKTVTATVSPDILRLANNSDLSISAIAHEAHRLDEQDDQEVVIKLR